MASTRQDGRIDTIYRRYAISAAQAVETFGLDNLSDKAKDKARLKPDDMVQFVRVIEPRSGAQDGARMSKNMPFASCDVEVDGKR